MGRAETFAAGRRAFVTRCAALCVRSESTPGLDDDAPPIEHHSALTLSLSEAKVPPPAPETNAVYAIEPNPLGVQQWAVSWDNPASRVGFEINGRTHTLMNGIGSRRYCDTPHFDTVAVRSIGERVEMSFLNSPTLMAAAMHSETRPVLQGLART